MYFILIFVDIPIEYIFLYFWVNQITIEGKTSRKPNNFGDEL